MMSLTLEQQIEELTKRLQQEHATVVALAELCGLYIECGSEADTIKIKNIREEVAYTTMAHGYHGFLEATLWLNQHKIMLLARITRML